MKRYYLLAVLLVLPWLIEITPVGDSQGASQGEQKVEAEAADLIIHHAKVLTVDAKFSVAEAIAIKDDQIVAVGKNETILRQAGAKTKVMDAQGRTVLP